eukprot:6197997-Lingulodinium_polyedra.AAC.1
MLVPGVTTPVPEGCTYVVTYYPIGARSAVVESDDDNLTAEEMKKHASAVQAAKVKELITWQHYKCFS